MIPLVTVDTVYIATVATIINGCNGSLYIGKLKGMKRMKKVKLTNLHWEPVYIVPRQDGLPRRGWYLADDIGCGFDLYRGGCGYIAYEDIGTLYDVFVDYSQELGQVKS